MRGPKIDINPWLLERGAANLRRAMSMEANGSVPQDDDSYMKDPCLQGYCVRYSKSFDYKGLHTVIVKGAFAKASNRTNVTVMLDHQPDTKYGNVPILLDDENGVAFRYRLPQSTRGGILNQMVSSFARPDVSIGYETIASFVRKVDDKDVRFITEAKLVELSIVKHGKCPNAYTRVIDASKEKSLRHASERGLLLFDGAAQEFNRTLSQYAKNAASLARLARELNE